MNLSGTSKIYEKSKMRELQFPCWDLFRMWGDSPYTGRLTICWKPSCMREPVVEHLSIQKLRHRDSSSDRWGESHPNQLDYSGFWHCTTCQASRQNVDSASSRNACVSDQDAAMCCLSAGLKTRASGDSSPRGCTLAELGFDHRTFGL